MLFPAHMGMVTLGTTMLASMYSWENPGIENELIEKPEFRAKFKKFVYGVQNGGVVPFEGWFDAEDTEGQLVLMAAAENKTSITNLRLYYGEGETNFFHATPGATCLASNVKIGDETPSGLIPISFQFQVSKGFMGRVAGYYNGTDVSFGNEYEAQDWIRVGGDLAGFVEEQKILVEGSDSNDGAYSIVSVWGKYISINGMGLLTEEGSGANVSLISFPLQ